MKKDETSLISWGSDPDTAARQGRLCVHPVYWKGCTRVQRGLKPLNTIFESRVVQNDRFFFFSKSSWSRNSPLRGGFSAASLRGWKESQARVTVLSFILTFLFGLGGFSGRHRKIGRLSKSSWCVGNNNNNNNMSATHTLLKNLGCDHWVSESLVWPRHAKEKGAVLERLCYVTLAWEADRCLQHHHCMQTL